MAKYVIIIISMVLVNNYPLAQFLGICPFLGVSKDMDSARGMGIAVTFVMVLATAVTWPIQQFLLHSRYRCARSADRDVHEEKHGRPL